MKTGSFNNGKLINHDVLVPSRNIPVEGLIITGGNLDRNNGDLINDSVIKDFIMPSQPDLFKNQEKVLIKR